MTNTDPLNVLAEKQIRDLFDDMKMASPSEKRSIAGAIKGIAESLPALSGMDDSFQKALMEMLAGMAAPTKPETSTEPKTDE